MRVRDSHEPSEGKEQLWLSCTLGGGCPEPTDVSVQEGTEKQLLRPGTCQGCGLSCYRAPRTSLYTLGGARASAASAGKTTDVNEMGLGAAAALRGQR